MIKLSAYLIGVGLEALYILRSNQPTNQPTNQWLSCRRERTQTFYVENLWWNPPPCASELLKAGNKGEPHLYSVFKQKTCLGAFSIMHYVRDIKNI